MIRNKKNRKENKRMYFDAEPNKRRGIIKKKKKRGSHEVTEERRDRDKDG